MPTPRYCGACGSAIPSGDRYCSSCGRVAIENDEGAHGFQAKTNVPRADQHENIVFENQHGRITDRRLILESRGIWRSQYRRDIPLRSISSVEYQVDDHPIIGSFFFIIGAVMLTQGFQRAVIGAAAIAIAITLFFGARKIIIGIANGEGQQIDIFRFKSQDALPFVEALREQLFKNAPMPQTEPTPRWG